MKKFENPAIEIIEIAVEDVIAASNCDDDNNLPEEEI